MNFAPMTDPLLDTSEDAFLGGQLRLQQPKSGHRAGHDAMLLAAATAARPGSVAVEFGAGIGAPGLARARRGRATSITRFEIEPRLVELARHNAASNAIDASVIALDVAS